MQVIEHDDTRRFPELYSPERMGEVLEENNVKEVRVFNLKKGMEVRVESSLYKVIAVRSNGKITLRRKQ